MLGCSPPELCSSKKPYSTASPHFALRLRNLLMLSQLLFYFATKKVTYNDSGLRGAGDTIYAGYEGCEVEGQAEATEPSEAKATETKRRPRRAT